MLENTIFVMNKVSLFWNDMVKSSKLKGRTTIPLSLRFYYKKKSAERSKQTQVIREIAMS
jgi:hypothetical protein